MIYTMNEIRERIMPIVQKYNIPAIYCLDRMPGARRRKTAIWIFW